MYLYSTFHSTRSITLRHWLRENSYLRVNNNRVKFDDRKIRSSSNENCLKYRVSKRRIFDNRWLIARAKGKSRSVKFIFDLNLLQEKCSSFILLININSRNWRWIQRWIYICSFLKREAWNFIERYIFIERIKRVRFIDKYFCRAGKNTTETRSIKGISFR